MTRPVLKYSCGHSWMECPVCGWTLPVKFQRKEHIVALLTAGGQRPIDEPVQQALDKNNKERKKAWAIAYAHTNKH